MFSEPDGTGKTVPTNQPILLEVVRGDQPSHTRARRESTPTAQAAGKTLEPAGTLPHPRRSSRVAQRHAAAVAGKCSS